MSFISALRKNCCRWWESTVRLKTLQRSKDRVQRRKSAMLSKIRMTMFWWTSRKAVESASLTVCVFKIVQINYSKQNAQRVTCTPFQVKYNYCWRKCFQHTLQTVFGNVLNGDGYHRFFNLQCFRGCYPSFFEAL